MRDLFEKLKDGAGHRSALFLMIHIATVPLGKGRPRTRVVRPKRGGAPIAMIYTPRHTQIEEQRAKIMASQAMRGKQVVEGPLALRLVAVFPVPQSWNAAKRDLALRGVLPHTSKPDFDNVVKLYCDALSGVVWKDDDQIAMALIEKRYGEFPGVTIEVHHIL